MNDPMTKVARLEAELERVAVERDDARQLLREMGAENARLRANVAVLTQAVADHRRAMRHPSVEEGPRPCPICHQPEALHAKVWSKGNELPECPAPSPEAHARCPECGGEGGPSDAQVPDERGMGPIPARPRPPRQGERHPER